MKNELTQAQQVILNVLNDEKLRLGHEPINLEEFIEDLSTPDAILFEKAMEDYARIKWDECCDTLREELQNILIANDFFVTHINPEFKP